MLLAALPATLLAGQGRFYRPGRVILTPPARVCFGRPDVDGLFLVGDAVTVALALRLGLTVPAEVSFRRR
ncbi:MAG: hypothetical protein R6U63_04245 [Longimicrobiales bacterium]